MIAVAQGDCLEVMKNIPDHSVDMILCDLPYGTTACAWDCVIDLDRLWEHYSRIVKTDAAIVLFCKMPFTANLVVSNLKSFRFCYVWEKGSGAGFLNANRIPLPVTEDVCVFSIKACKYFPIMRTGKMRKKGGSSHSDESVHGEYKSQTTVNDQYYPTNILDFSNAGRKDKVHPTQKPVELCEYLIKTYTNEGDTVLDNCMGSGTTGVACVNTNRSFLGIEKDEKYFQIASERIHKAMHEKGTI